MSTVFDGLRELCANCQTSVISRRRCLGVMIDTCLGYRNRFLDSLRHCTSYKRDPTTQYKTTQATISTQDARFRVDNSGNPIASQSFLIIRHWVMTCNPDLLPKTLSLRSSSTPYVAMEAQEIGGWINSF
ncbi:hypothetical protein ACTXT7_006084 [Hymenolepis weldensis]